MPASKWGRQSRGGLRVQQMAQIDAYELDYVGLTALRDGMATRAPSPALAILQLARPARRRGSLRKSDRTILEVIATATRAENACDRHGRHRDPIRGPL